MISRTWTEEQQAAALWWIGDQLDHPDLICQYLMQLTHELMQLPVRFFGGTLNAEPMDRLRLKFEKAKAAEPEKKAEPSAKWVDEASKSIAAMRLGCGVEIRTIKKSEVVW